MKIIIQKFGGTILADKAARQQAAMCVRDIITEGYTPVVVVSAPGRKGFPYATDSLMDFISNEMENPEPRSADLLLSCGEVIASVLFSQTLRSININSIPLTGFQAGILTDENFNIARVKKVFLKNIIELLNKGQIPVVAGFQGITENGDITTLGRGGSDTTASVLGAALQADEVRFYKDVDGIFTADPRTVYQARVIEELNYEEAVELSSEGANVIHPRAVEVASVAHLPLRIGACTSRSEGTVIKNIKSDRFITGIVSKPNVALVRLVLNSANDHQKGLGVFSLLATHNISVDFIDINQEKISFVIESDLQPKVESLLISRQFQFSMQNQFTKISLVGAGMTGQPGIMAKIVEALQEKKITIYESTDSRTTISCLIDIAEEKNAILALYDKFELDKK
jgi:aspartate kinase